MASRTEWRRAMTVTLGVVALELAARLVFWPTIYLAR